MEHYVWLALMATLGTWFVTALGAATVVFFKSPSARALNLMLGFSSGVMIAASFWSLLQPAIQRAEAAGNTPAWLVAVSGFLLGALFLWGSDKAVGLARKRAGMGMPGERLNRIIMLVLSITLHNIPEGLAVGVAFGALGTGASPDGLMGAVSIAVASVCRISRRGRRFPCRCAARAIPGAGASCWGRPPAWWSRCPG